KAIIEHRYEYLRQFEHRALPDLLSLYSLKGEGAISQAVWAKLGERHRRILYYPFTNKQVIEQLYRTPWSFRLKEPKMVLREVARGLGIPEFIVSRRKSGFGIPAERWSGRRGVFEGLVPLASRVFGEKEVRRVQCTTPPKSMIFWNMINYAIWRRLHIAAEPVESLLGEID